MRDSVKVIHIGMLEWTCYWKDFIYSVAVSETAGATQLKEKFALQT